MIYFEEDEDILFEDKDSGSDDFDEPLKVSNYQSYDDEGVTKEKMFDFSTLTTKSLLIPIFAIMIITVIILFVFTGSLGSIGGTSVLPLNNGNMMIGQSGTLSIQHSSLSDSLYTMKVTLDGVKICPNSAHYSASSGTYILVNAIMTVENVGSEKIDPNYYSINLVDGTGKEFKEYFSGEFYEYDEIAGDLPATDLSLQYGKGTRLQTLYPGDSEKIVAQIKVYDYENYNQKFLDKGLLIRFKYVNTAEISGKDAGR